MVKCVQHIAREIMGHEPIAPAWTHLNRSGHRSSNGSRNNLMQLPKICFSVCREACPAFSRRGNCELSNEESNTGAAKSLANWCSVLNSDQLWKPNYAPAPQPIPRGYAHDQRTGFQIHQTRGETGVRAPALPRRASAKRKGSISGMLPDSPWRRA